MLTLIATVALMAEPAQVQPFPAASINEETAVYVTTDPVEYALPFIRPRGSASVFRWVRLRDPVFDDRFAYAQMNGYYDGLLVELDQPCRELFRSSGAVPLVKHEFFRVNETLCSTREIYAVPNEAAGRALAVNLQVRQARENGEAWPEDPIEAATAYLEGTESR
jgi:hypothetical protein